LRIEGYISKYVALLNPEKLGLQLTILVLVGLSSHDSKKMDGFEKVIKSLPEVIQCYLIAGQAADYMLKVVVSSLNEYQSFLLDKLTRIDGVSTVHSSFVLRSIVEKTALPINHLK
jgi:Lrp/AsnC family leucine-responsive transcriptional regulator